jgi:hypothetical protein
MLLFVPHNILCALYFPILYRFQPYIDVTFFVDMHSSTTYDGPLNAKLLYRYGSGAGRAHLQTFPRHTAHVQVASCWSSLLQTVP